jgi:hypothetical protein
MHGDHLGGVATYQCEKQLLKLYRDIPGQELGSFLQGVERNSWRSTLTSKNGSSSRRGVTVVEYFVEENGTNLQRTGV